MGGYYLEVIDAMILIDFGKDFTFHQQFFSCGKIKSKDFLSKKSLYRTLN